MVQVIGQGRLKPKSFGQQIGEGASRVASEGSNFFLQQKMQQEAAKHDAEAKRNMLEFEYGLKGDLEARKQSERFSQQKRLLEESGLGKYLGMGGQERASSLQGGQRQDIPNEQREIDEGNVNIPSLIPEEEIYKAEILGQRGIAQQMREHNKNISDEIRHQQKLDERQSTAAKKETMPLRKQYADQAKYAKDAIKNKQLQLGLVRKGNLDSPERVFFASLLPGALGNKLLSADTQLFKSGLFEEFGVLKSMFPGQIRVKEIELLEDKLASLEKSHEAKEKILETGIAKLDIPLIKAKAAQKVEKQHPKASILEFEELVDKYSAEQLDKAYENIKKSYDKIYYEYAPEKNTLIDQNGHIYRDVPKKLLKSLYEEAEKEGLELRPHR